MKNWKLDIKEQTIANLQFVLEAIIFIRICSLQNVNHFISASVGSVLWYLWLCLHVLVFDPHEIMTAGRVSQDDSS